MCNEDLPKEKVLPFDSYDDGNETFPLLHVASEYHDESIPYAAQEEIQAEVGNEYIWSEGAKFVELENYDPQEEITETDEENVTLESQPMEQEDPETCSKHDTVNKEELSTGTEDPETCTKHDIVNEEDLSPVKAAEDEDHTKPRRKTYCKEKYHLKQWFESEVQRTRRLARRREYNKKYFKKKREKQLIEGIQVDEPKKHLNRGRPRNPRRETEEAEQVLKRLKENERRKRSRQRETPEKRERRLSYMRDYKRRKAQRRTENSLATAEKADGSDGKPCDPSILSTTLPEDGSSIEISCFRKTIDNHGRSAVEMARGLPRLEVRLERIDVNKVIEEIRTRSYQPNAAGRNYFI